MSSPPRLSVTALIPTYNRSAFLPEALDGVLSQTSPPDEVIVVDDGSTEDIAGIVARYGSRVRYLRQDNAGKSVALNRGLSQAAGEAIWIFDDDDVPMPDALERLQAGLRSDPGAGFAYGQHDYLVQGPGGWVAQPVAEPNRLGEALNVAVLRQCLVHQPGMLVRRLCYDAVGPFDEALLRSQDYDMLLRLSRRFRGVRVEGVVFHQRKHDGRRGPARAQSAASAQSETWARYDKPIFERIHADYGLEEFLPAGPSPEQGAADTGLALLTRAAVMARRGLWARAAADIGAYGEHLAATGRTEPTGVERRSLSTVFDWAGRGLQEAGAAEPFFAAVRALAARPRRALAAALRAPLPGRLKRAVRTGRMGEAGAALRAAARLSFGRGAAAPGAPLTVVFPFRTSGIGGSHMATFALARALVERGDIKVVLLLNGENEIAAEARQLGLAVAFTGEEPAMRNMPWVDAARLRWRMHILSAYGSRCVVHCNDLGVLQSWGVAAKFLGRPVVYHNHALNRMIPPNTTLIRLADKVLCVSRACRDAVRFMPERKVVAVLNPISIPAVVDRIVARRGLAQALGLSEGDRLAGFVGNFWSRKRPLFALQAFAVMSARAPDLRLIFFGRAGDVDEARLEAEAERLGVRAKVAFAGFRLPLEQNIAALDLLMMPAVHEPFGRTLVEAALLGTPYVATDDAGHHEIAARWGGGALAPLDATPEAFAEAAMALLDDPSLVLLGADALVGVAETFSPTRQAEAVIACYREILGAEPG